MKKITYSEICKWCEDHTMIPRRVYLGIGNDYRLVFENGDKYEFDSHCEGDLKHVTIRLNGEYESKTTWRDGWLKNGSYGSVLVSEA